MQRPKLKANTRVVLRTAPAPVALAVWKAVRPRERAHYRVQVDALMRYRTAIDELERYRETLTVNGTPNESFERSSSLINSFHQAQARLVEGLEVGGFWSLECGCDVVFGNDEDRCTYRHLDDPDLGSGLADDRHLVTP